MNKKILLATLVAAIANFFAGWLIFGMMMKNFYVENMVHYDGLIKDPPDIIGYAVGSLLYAWLLSYIFDRWANFRTIGKGFMGGVIVFLPICLGVDMNMFASMNVYGNSTAILIDTLAGTLMGGITGAVAGWMLGMGGRKADA